MKNNPDQVSDTPEEQGLLARLLIAVVGRIECACGRHDWGDTNRPLLAIYCERCGTEACSYR